MLLTFLIVGRNGHHTLYTFQQGINLSFPHLSIPWLSSQSMQDEDEKSKRNTITMSERYNKIGSKRVREMRSIQCACHAVTNLTFSERVHLLICDHTHKKVCKN